MSSSAFDPLGTVFLIVFFIVVAVLFLKSSIVVVRQQTVAVIERFGKYNATFSSGIHFKVPFGIDSVVSRIPLRMQQTELEVETKTKDNVFVLMNVATQFKVNSDSVTDAYYKLMRPEEQIRSYIEDALRSAVPKLELDEVFEKKDEIALAVQQQVSEEMKTYGYIIIKSLITRVEPDAEVKQSMNEINAAKRKQDASQMLANAEKIKIVTAAEAEAEKDRLRGEGIAKQRKAIVDGLASQLRELKEEGETLNEDQIMSILLANQYLDTLDTFAKNGNATVFLPTGVQGSEDIRTQVMTALAGSNTHQSSQAQQDDSTSDSEQWS